MDEAEKYQQRLQVIAEKRRVQEEENRVKREMEEEWLRLAQRKRKSLRDQWLMEPTPSSAEASGTQIAPWPPAQSNEDSTDKTQHMQKEIKEDEKTVNINDEGPALFMEIKRSNLSEDNTEEPTQANPWQEETKASAASEISMGISPGVHLQNRQLDRSVLGVLEIQVEKDLKTGVTTIKSMAPLLATALESKGEAVFDDGRRTVHAVGGAEGSQHSEEELSQILNVVSKVGMQTILHGVTLTCSEEQGVQKETNAMPEDEQSSESVGGSSDLTHYTLQQKKTSEIEDYVSLVASKTEVEEMRLNGRTNGVDKEKEVKRKQKEREVEVEKDEWEMVNCRPEEGLDPVVLTFLGFKQVQTDSGLGYEDEGVLLKVEQVFVAGEEDLGVDPSEELSTVSVKNNAQCEEPPKCDESQPEPVVSVASCPEGTREDTPAEVILQNVCIVSGTGMSVPLQELQHLSSDTTDVLGETKEVIEYSTEGAKEYTEEKNMHMGRTSVVVEGLEKTSNIEDEGQVFQDVPLDGNGETSQTLIQKEIVAQSIEKEPEIKAVVPPSNTPKRAVGEMPTKHKTCQCCSLM